MGEEGYHYMAAAYDVTEFATSLKPFVLRQLLNEADVVLYLDPDICIYAPLHPLIDSTVSAGWSLTPHCLQPIARDGRFPSEADIMAAGVYNLGYIGVTRAALPMLGWWSERLRHHSLIDPSIHLFTDQRWIDLAIPLFSPHIERSPAYNVAYWNLDQRVLHRTGSSVWVGEERLRFFHFSGYDRTKPWWLSRYTPTNPRALLSDHPVARELGEQYALDVLASETNHHDELTYGWAEAFPGLTLDRPLRRMYHDELVRAAPTGAPRPPTPFLPGGATEFRRWLSEPSPTGQTALPRFLELLWLARADLRHHFPEVAGGATDRFWEWTRARGRFESQPLALLELAEPRPTTVVTDISREHFGVDVVGYFTAELGTGEAVRLITAALEAAGVPVSSIRCHQSASRQQHAFRAPDPARHDAVLLSVNADQLASVRQQLGDAFFRDRHVIGQWFWEVEHFPQDLAHAFSLLDEVWVATEHIRRALVTTALNRPVHVMPIPLIAPPIVDGLAKSDFGLDDRFTFLFSFDFLSVFERKNPIAVVHAFTAAFSNEEGPMLMIKTINGAHHQQQLEQLRWAARGRSDIVVFDGHMDRAVIGALFAACDCYVSLHRAEGLGLTMAEAMALGKPVIATAYSGNMDFMTPETAYLVPWTSTSIGHGAGPYPADGFWAEPDVPTAAQLMRRVVEDPIGATQVGAAAREDLANRFSPVASGVRIRDRLLELWELRHG